MKYSIERSDKTGRYKSTKTASRSGGVSIKTGKASNSVSEETVRSAKAAANTSYHELTSKK